MLSTCFLFLLVTPSPPHQHVFTVAFYSSLYSPTNNYHTTLRTSKKINCQRSAFHTHSTYLWSQRHQYLHSFSKIWISTTREPSPKPLNIKKLELFPFWSLRPRAASCSCFLLSPQYCPQFVVSVLQFLVSNYLCLIIFVDTIWMVSDFYLHPDKYNEFIFISTLVNSHIAYNFFKVKLQNKNKSLRKIFLM